MNRNVGGMDRTARLIVGPILAVVGIAAIAGLLSIGEGLAATVVALLLLVVGTVLLVTGGVQKCPINEAAGRNTYEGQD